MNDMELTICGDIYELMIDYETVCTSSTQASTATKKQQQLFDWPPVVRISGV